VAFSRNASKALRSVQIQGEDFRQILPNKINNEMPQPNLQLSDFSVCVERVLGDL
jgi:hypothetical protein